MTLRLSPGLAFAEDPGGGASFGAHRCLLLAEAVVAAAERGLHTTEGRLEIVRERFSEAGTTLDAPYLGSPAGALPTPAIRSTGWGGRDPHPPGAGGRGAGGVPRGRPRRSVRRSSGS